ncbi:hypothetical protein ERO13_A05G217866v2, partial [Gossypium hirsutum]
KNHELHPTGSAPFPEANVSLHNGQELKETHYANSSVRGCGLGRGRGRVHRYGYGRGDRFKNSHSYQKWDRKNGNREEKEKGENVTNVCYYYEEKGHWSRVCRTQKHLVDFYQQSIKQKGKKVETNLVYKDGEVGGEIKQLDKKISWKELSLAHLDLRTKQCDLEVQKIIHLQSLAN